MWPGVQDFRFTFDFRVIWQHMSTSQSTLKFVTVRSVPEAGLPEFVVKCRFEIWPIFRSHGSRLLIVCENCDTGLIAVLIDKPRPEGGSCYRFS